MLPSGIVAALPNDTRFLGLVAMGFGSPSADFTDKNGPLDLDPSDDF